MNENTENQPIGQEVQGPSGVEARTRKGEAQTEQENVSSTSRNTAIANTDISTTTNHKTDSDTTTNTNRKITKYAWFVKTGLQWLVGISLIFFLIVRAIYRIVGAFHNIPLGSLPFDPFVNVPTLKVVSLALFYSTAIELAYAFFTPYLDEAVTPLITGFAAAILLGISEITSVNITNAGGILLLVLALAAVLTLNKIFFDKRTSNKAQEDKSGTSTMGNSSENTDAQHYEEVFSTKFFRRFNLSLYRRKKM